MWRFGKLSHFSLLLIAKNLPTCYFIFDRQNKLYGNVNWKKRRNGYRTRFIRAGKGGKG
jgi:hypothetical protein